MSDEPLPAEEGPPSVPQGPIAEWDQPEVSYVLPAETLEVIATETYPTAVLATSLSVPNEIGLMPALRELEQAVTGRLDALQSAFDREIRAEATREKVVDRLHAELQEYKGDLLLQTLRPIFVDLIQLHDDIGKVIDAQGSAVEGESRRMLDFMRGIQQGIEDILYRQGVEPFAVEGAAFDPRRQRAVATVAAEDPGLARTIAQRYRKGFRAGEKVIRPEIVSVYAEKRS